MGDMHSDNVTLHRLLKRQVTPLLEAFVGAMPGMSMALLETDGELFESAGGVDSTTLSQMLEAVSKGGTGDYRCYTLTYGLRLLGWLVVRGESPGGDYGPECALHRTLELLLACSMEKRDIAEDTLNRYRELNLLYRVSETIGTALDPELIPEMVLEESKRVIPADVGVEVGVFVVRLPDVRGDCRWESKASFGGAEQVGALNEIIQSEVDRLLEKGLPAILTDLPPATGKYRRYRYSAVLWAPLKTPKRVLGGILLGRLEGQPIFTANDEKLLMSLALQSALALENARLFAQTDEQLARRVEELDAFAHTVAHDLKGPLALTMSYTSFLEDEWHDMEEEEVQKLLGLVVGSTYKLQNIINELLLLSSVRKEDVELTTLEMGGIIEEVRKGLAYMFEEYEAEVITPETWPVAVGPPWIEEVWSNYISNAMKYGGEPPRIELGAEEWPDDMVRFWVRDNGPGLTREERARLFTPFTKLGHVRVKGHGLGLSIVQRIIEKLGGQVGVESEVGQGSLFYFTLPTTMPD